MTLRLTLSVLVAFFAVTRLGAPADLDERETQLRQRFRPASKVCSR
jgi:hypothetical protein